MSKMKRHCPVCNAFFYSHRTNSCFKGSCCMDLGSEKHRLLIENLPIAFACHQIIADSSGKPVDYLFLDVNCAFEKMTGLSRDAVLGKKVTEVLPDIAHDSFDWIGTYGRVAQGGEDFCFEQYFKPLGRWFAVTAYSDEPGYFATIFHDITAQKNEEDTLRNREQEQLSHYHRAMCSASIALSEAVQEQEILANIATYLQKLTGAFATSVSLYEQSSKNLYLSYHTFSPEQKTMIESLLGADIFSLKWPINAIQQAEIKKKIINRPVSITELTWGSVPQHISELLQEQFKIEGITSLALYYHGELMGSAVAYLGSDQLNPPDELLKTFGHIGGLALSRHRGEKALQKSEERYRLLVENANEGIMINQGGRFKFINPKALEIFSCSREELQSKAVTDFIHPDDRNFVLSRIGKREKREVLQDKYTCKIIAGDGCIKWIEENASIIEWEGKTASLSLIEDITERKLAERQLTKITRDYETIFQGTQDAMFLVEVVEEGIFRYIRNNWAHEKATGFSAEEIKEKTPQELVGKELGDIIAANYSRCLREARPVSYEETLDLPGGEKIWHTTLTPAFDDQNIYIIGSSQDITERKQAEEKIRYLSFHDSLTGLYNRAYLENEMQRMNTRRQLPISIIMADLNGLKLVNDTYGHNTGDEMLKLAALILKDSCRKEDIIARWGGDEFVIFLPQTGEREAKTICERIQDRCRDAYVENIPISIALGVSDKESAGNELAVTLKEAEDHMYKQKLAKSRSTRSAVLNALLKMLGTKSFETETHTVQMQAIAFQIGERLELPDTELNRLTLLITLHDIGKINISKVFLSFLESEEV